MLGVTWRGGRFDSSPSCYNNNNMGNLREEIAYLEYGKKFAELTAGEQREVECQYDDLVNTY